MKENLLSPSDDGRWYVVIERRWMRGKKYWRSVIFATHEQPYEDRTSLLAVYEVRANNRYDALGAVVEWLALGRPSAMRVREARALVSVPTQERETT